MDIEFSDLTYTVKDTWRLRKGNQKTVLHGVSGSFRSGQLSAIMGPSGAGKSSLLNILSGYRTSGVKGMLKVNGKPLNRKLFHKCSRYITQEDVLPPLLTTQEAMVVAASLKLPSSITKKQRDMLIEETLSMLGLLECCDTRTEQLSGGQKKRLSIALEMINNPSVFFLDEPTSGLDNVSTAQCLRLLSDLAKQGRTIVCTIHQPSASLFQLFDSVYVLGRGRCVYQGSTQQLLPFMSTTGFHCPTYHNPADFVIEVTDSEDKNIAILSKAIDNGKMSYTTAKDITSQLEQITCHSTDQDTKGKEKTEISRQSSSDGSDNSFSTAGYKRMGLFSDTDGDYAVSSWQQFWVLLNRMFLQFSRNQVALKIQFLHHLMCGLLVGCVFYDSANDGYQMFNHMKFCVGYILFHTYTNVMMPVLVYPAEVRLVKREYFNRWYRLNPYYIALFISKLPSMIVLGTMFNALVYFLSGLPAQPIRFAIFSLIGFQVALVSDAVGMAIGSIFNVTNGSAVGPAVVAPFLGLAVYGFDFARDVTWLTYAIMKLSFLRCGVVATAVTIFGFDRETLFCDEIYCHFKEPKLILHFLDVEHVSVWSELATIALIMCFFRIVSYCALRFRLLV